MASVKKPAKRFIVIRKSQDGWSSVFGDEVITESKARQSAATYCSQNNRGRSYTVCELVPRYSYEPAPVQEKKL